MNNAPHDDGWIARAVAEELEWAPHVDAAHIDVTVQDGIVQMTGYVSTLVEKKAAERAVWHVAGVRGIVANLDIRRPAAHLHSDEEIARRAADVLDWDAQLPGADIKVQVEDGVVTLIGGVDWQYQREDAEARVHHLAGVLAVRNDLVVRSVPSSAEAMREQVLRALQRHSEIDASQIEVAVEGGCVTLGGSVPSFAQRRIAENAAWSARGVSDVVDHVRVEPIRKIALPV